MPASTVAERGHACLKGRGHVVRGPQQAHVVVVVEVNVFPPSSVAGHVGMGVAVDEARQERGGGKLQYLPACAVRQPKLVVGAN